MIPTKLNNWLKSSFRLVLTAMICILVFICSLHPAQAITSKPNDGEVSLNRIQAKTDDVADSNPRGLKEITKEAQGGLNAVQGSADKSKMISPEDANDATTVKEQAEGFLKNLTD